MILILTVFGDEAEKIVSIFIGTIFWYTTTIHTIQLQKKYEKGGERSIFYNLPHIGNTSFSAYGLRKLRSALLRTSRDSVQIINTYEKMGYQPSLHF